MTFLAGALAGALIVGPACWMVGRARTARLDRRGRDALWKAGREHGRMLADLEHRYPEAEGTEMYGSTHPNPKEA